jgi:hypothetical protein
MFNCLHLLKYQQVLKGKKEGMERERKALRGTKREKRAYIQCGRIDAI